MDRILIADDDPVMLMSLDEILQAEGFETLTAIDGNEAETLVEQKASDISAIILDWTMPWKSGIEVLRWIKQQKSSRHLPVIMHTVITEPSHIKEGIDAGAFYYLTKPSDHDVLLSIVRTAVYDFHTMKTLRQKVNECENPLMLMLEGKFRLQTLEEGEYLSLRIANACPVPENVLVLSELIVNAIEHGNLGISYEEKSEYLSKSIWHNVLKERLRLPEYADKFVEITVKKHHDKMTILVKDDGPGFDFQRYLQLDASRAFDNHGRGIALANSYFDLQYLGSGNQVLVTIPFQ